MKMITSFDFRYKMEGVGVVNRDDAKVASRYAMREGATFHKNQSFAKTSVQMITYHDEGEEKQRFVRKAKLSKDLLRNALFSNEQPFQTSHLLAHLKTRKGSTFLPKMVATFSHLVRGFCYANDGGNAYKRKSPLLITDAIQTNDEVLKLEIGATGGTRTDTSLRYFDQAGPMIYKGVGSLDLVELAFVSCDPIFDRQAFNSDNYAEVVTLLKSRYGFNPSPEMAHYKKKKSEILIAERGMILPYEDCMSLAITTFERMQRIYIQRVAGFAKMVEIELVLTESNGTPFDFSESKYRLLINDSTDIRKELTDIFTKNDLTLFCGYELAECDEISARDVYEAEVNDVKKEKKAKKDAEEERKKSEKENSSTKEKSEKKNTKSKKR